MNDKDVINLFSPTDSRKASAIWEQCTEARRALYRALGETKLNELLNRRNGR